MSFYGKTYTLVRYCSVFRSLEPDSFQALDQPVDNRKSAACNGCLNRPSTKLPLSGQARDFGVETSSVLMLRSLKKDPSGLELDPEHMQVTQPKSWWMGYHGI